MEKIIIVGMILLIAIRDPREYIVILFGICMCIGIIIAKINIYISYIFFLIFIGAIVILYLFGFSIHPQHILSNTNISIIYLFYFLFYYLFLSPISHSIMSSDSLSLLLFMLDIHSSAIQYLCLLLFLLTLLFLLL